MKKTITYKEIKDKVLDIINNGGGGGGKSKLSELTDVTITSASNGQVLKYNGTKWINGAGGGIDIKSFTYTGNGEATTTITFPDAVKYVLSMKCQASSGARIKHNAFVWENGVIPASMVYTNAGTGTQIGEYTINNNTLTITGFADAIARLNENGTVTTIYYI